MNAPFHEVQGLITRESLNHVESTDLPKVLQGWSNLFGQRFGACFVFKFALQRGEGEKREGVQISKRSTHNL